MANKPFLWGFRGGWLTSHHIRLCQLSSGVLLDGPRKEIEHGVILP